MLLILFFLAFTFSGTAAAQFGPQSRTPALEGYDTVAYFTLGEPTLGREQFSIRWQGSLWLFASQEHLDLFMGNPTRYAPQYNGWCAYAAAKDYIAESDPRNAWTIHNDKLYLNWSPGVRRLWGLRRAANIKKANQNWQHLLEELTSGKATISRR